MYETLARLPQSRAKQPKRSLAEQARQHGLTPEEVGVFDVPRFLAFLWKVAGRPPNAPADWQRPRPLVIVVDNYSVHTGKRVREETPLLEAAGVSLFFLPSYAPELSKIESLWTDVKYHQMPQRSYERLGDLKQAAERALERKAQMLRAAHGKTEPLLPMPA